MQHLLVFGIQVDGLAEAVPEDQRLNGDGADDDRRDRQQDEGQRDHPRAFVRRTAVVPMAMIAMIRLGVRFVLVRMRMRGDRLMRVIGGVIGVRRFLPARLARGTS